jgi:hypothetical protein
MAMSSCFQCGYPLPENAKFCGQCGAVIQPNRKVPPAASRTLLAVPPPGSSPPAPFVTPVSKRTMVGLPPVVRDDAAKAATPGPPATHASAPAPASPARSLPRRTMLGVAMPGIAPLRAGDSGAPPAAAVPAPAPPEEVPPVARNDPSREYGATLHIPAFFVPPPAPLPEPPVPSRPRVAARRGAPLAVAALVAGGIALIGGAAIALLWRSAPPVTAQPRVGPDGADVLHLTCDPASCKDGTVVSFHNAKATFARGEADLSLATPLHIGDNALGLSIDRPGMGRDETVKLVVPVAYRVRADVTTMDDLHPCITIRVEAPAGTDVRIDDKAVTLDAAGMGSYLIEEADATEGPADESRVVAIDTPYVVVPKGRSPERGTVSARIAVAPLRVDAPGTSAVIDEDSVLIAGRAAKGATVTVDGRPVAVTPEGAFETTIPVGSMGERTIDVRASAAALAPRTVHVAITRVPSLTETAKAFEDRGPVGYDEAMREIAAAKTGMPIVVEGDVVESRAAGHRTLILIDDHRGCAKGPCLARVVVGRDLTLARGDHVRAYGRVARAYRTPGAQTVPEVEAEFVLHPKR